MYVFGIERSFFFERTNGAGSYLRKPREAGSYAVNAEGIANSVESPLCFHKGAGTDKAHLPNENVDKLRKLVRACFSKPSSDL